MAYPLKHLNDKSGSNFQPIVPDKVGYVNTTYNTITWDTTTSSPYDGWACIRASCTSTEGANLYVNGAAVIETGQLQISTTLFFHLMFPVKKGDTIKATGGGSIYKECKIYELRTGLDE